MAADRLPDPEVCATCDGDGYTEEWNPDQSGIVITPCPDCVPAVSAAVSPAEPPEIAHKEPEPMDSRERTLHFWLDCKGGGKGLVSVVGGETAACRQCADFAHAVLADKEEA